MSPEQAARDMLSRMGVMLNRDDFPTYPWEMSAGDVAELANLIAERDALRALLREARDDWIKVGYGASHEDVAACRDFCDRIDNMIGGSK